MTTKASNVMHKHKFKDLPSSKSLLAIIDKQVCMGVNMNLRMGYCKQILIDS